MRAIMRPQAGGAVIPAAGLQSRRKWKASTSAHAVLAALKPICTGVGFDPPPITKQASATP